MTDSSLFNIHGRLVRLQYPAVMGILNLSQNSFYKGSRNPDMESLEARLDQYIEEGVDIIDVGATSTRPGSPLQDAETELQRLLPVFSMIKKKAGNTLISIDTMNAETANILLQEGADLVNDVSAGDRDPLMLETVAKFNVPFIAMHMRGIPETMMNEENLRYENVVSEIIQYFARKKREFLSLGIHQLVVDPGYGFSKNLDQNYEVLKNLNLFQILDCPILVGLSRKSMITKLLGITPDEALYGTMSLHSLALLKGADILRVHDVKFAKDTIKINHKWIEVNAKVSL
ncbi:MAG: dihydropteroate synthase [Saprospiraceae bacterium]|nr:dihydropteroate synthase [Saprospiraceae bacterium]